MSRFSLNNTEFRSKLRQLWKGNTETLQTRSKKKETRIRKEEGGKKERKERRMRIEIGKWKGEERGMNRLLVGRISVFVTDCRKEL